MLLVLLPEKKAGGNREYHRRYERDGDYYTEGFGAE
jgi:hypothetical protein